VVYLQCVAGGNDITLTFTAGGAGKAAYELRSGGAVIASSPDDGGRWTVTIPAPPVGGQNFDLVALTASPGGNPTPISVAGRQNGAALQDTSGQNGLLGSVTNAGDGVQFYMGA